MICFSDAWRIHQIEKTIADPSHDFSKFGTGNTQTLDTIPKVNINKDNLFDRLIGT